MAYEQSLENIEVLKNLILPMQTHQVFFDFSNNSEFEMKFFNRIESANIIGKLMTTKFRSKLPLARIQYGPLEHEFFYYEDCNIRYEYNLTTQEILMHDSKEPFKKKSSAELVIEMNKLLIKLKNM